MNIRTPALILQALFISMNFFSATCTIADTTERLANMPEEIIFSAELCFQGSVDTTSEELAVVSTAYLRGKRFEWAGEIDHPVASEERFNPII